MTDTSPEPELSLTYSLTDEDIRAFAKIVLRRQLGRLFAIPAIVLGCMACALPLGVLARVFGHAGPQQELTLLGWTYPVFLLAYVLFLLAIRHLAVRKTVSLARRTGAIGEGHFLRATPSTLFTRTPGIGDGTRYWKACHAVEGHPDHILIFVQPNFAYVIPRRAFSSPVAATDFLDRTKHWLETARSEPGSR